MNDLSSMVLQAFGKGIVMAAPALWPFLALILLLVLGKFIYRWYEARRLAGSGILEIDQMDGKTFEKYLEVLFKKLGYSVERTRYIGDYGADLVTVKNGIKTIIQAKRHKGKVGIKAVQEAVAAKGYYECSAAMVVTNSIYTKQARELARANGVQLWDRDRLVDALLSVKSNIEQDVAMQISATLDPGPTEPAPATINDICAICGNPVSEKVKQYCLDHADRFQGQIYCFQHQKTIPNKK